MKLFSATTTIAAAPETIWQILTNAAAFPEWEPGVERIEGRIAPGETIKAFNKISPGRAFPVKVTEFVPNRRMMWASGMPLGLFKGERTFTLTPLDNGLTEFTLREEFSGPLLPLIGRSIPDMTDSFQQFVAGLKRRAESSSTHT